MPSLHSDKNAEVEKYWSQHESRILRACFSKTNKANSLKFGIQFNLNMYAKFECFPKLENWMGAMPISPCTRATDLNKVMVSAERII